jgi:uncharacterized protein (TIGR02996 family)
VQLRDDLSEEFVYRAAPDGKVARAGADLVTRGAFSQPKISADGTRLSALCQGSMAQPYRVDVHFTGPGNLQTACNCDSHKHPCKHALGLLFLAVRSPEQFDGAPKPVESGPALAVQDSGSTSARRFGRLGLTEAPVRKSAEDAPAPAELGEALFQGILAEPEEDVPRLVYADWLEEQGDADLLARATFIRLQLDLARMSADDGRRPELVEREAKLWKRYRVRWLDSVPKHLRGSGVHFQRGFLDEMTLQALAWARWSEKLFERQPLHRVEVTSARAIDPDVAGQLAVIPQFTRVRSITFRTPSFDEPTRTLRILLGTPFLANLRRLSLMLCHLTSREMTELTASPHLGKLVELDLSGNRIGPTGAQTLAAAPWGSLRRLVLANNPLGEGARALLPLAQRPELELLDLRNVNLGPALSGLLRDAFGSRVLLNRDSAQPGGAGATS